MQIAVLTLCVADKFRKYTNLYKNVVFVPIAGLPVRSIQNIGLDIGLTPNIGTRLA